MIGILIAFVVAGVFVIAYRNDQKPIYDDVDLHGGGPY